MIKLLIAGTVILLIAFGGIYLSVTQNKKSPTKISSSIDAPASTPHEIPLGDPPQSSPASLSSPKPSAAPQTSSAPSLTSLQNQVAALEKSNQDLLTRVSRLENTQTTTTVSTSNQVTVSKAPQYIYPSGSGGSTTSTDWSTLSSYDITIDPALYSGYTSMQLEVQMLLTSGNGTAYARLQDTSNGTSILNSQASTSSENYTWTSSSNFTVSGKKSYKLQLKTLTGYQVSVNDLRIKVNF